MKVLLVLLFTFANYSYVSPTIAVQHSLSLIAYNRTQKWLSQASSTCASVTINCPKYAQPNTPPAPWPACVYIYSYIGHSLVAPVTTCTINGTNLPVIDKSEGYSNYLPTLYNIPFFTSLADYKQMYDSFQIYNASGKIYVNMSTLPTYGTAISASGKIKVSYVSDRITVYFCSDIPSNQGCAVTLSDTTLFPILAFRAEMSLVSVDVSEEFLIAFFASQNGGSGVALRVFVIDLDAKDVANKIKKFQINNKDVDLFFEGSYNGTRIGSFIVNNCHRGSVAIDKTGTTEYILAAIVTCPQSIYTYNLVMRAQPVGTALVFVLRENGEWMGKDNPLLLVPNIPANASLISLNRDFRIKTAVIQNGMAFLSGESRVLYHTVISTSDYSILRSKVKTLSSIVVFESGAKPLTANPEPGIGTSTVGPAMAFTHKRTILVGIDSDETPAMIVEYDLSNPLKITKIGAIVNMSTPHKVFPLGSGLDVIAIIDNQDKNQVKFAPLPSAHREEKSQNKSISKTSFIPWMTITAPTVVSTVEEAMEFSLPPNSVSPRSKRSLVSIAYSNDNIIAFNPLNNNEQTVYLGNFSIYNVNIIEDSSRLEVNPRMPMAGQDVIITYHTSLKIIGDASTYINNCSIFTLQYIDNSISLLPKAVTVKTHTVTDQGTSNQFLSCDYTFQGPIYAHIYQIKLSSGGVVVATSEISVIAGNQATVNTVIFNPSILRRKQPFSVSVVAGDKYGNKLTFPDTRATAPTPQCEKFKLTIYDISQYPEDIDYSIINNVPNLKQIKSLRFSRNGTQYCTSEAYIIEGEGQYFFKITDNEDKDIELPSTVMQSLITWVNPPVGLRYSAMAWGKLIMAIILLGLIIFVVPFLLYRYFNRAPETVFGKAYKKGSKGSTLEEREAIRKKFYSTTLNTSGQRILPGISLISMARTKLINNLNSEEDSEIASSMLTVPNNVDSDLIGQIYTIYSNLNQNTIEEIRQVKDNITIGKSQCCVIGNCSGCTYHSPNDGIVFIYSFPAVAGARHEPVLAFAYEFTSYDAMETYLDQVTVWSLLPNKDGRLDIRGIFAYETTQSSPNKHIGIPGVLDILSSKHSYFAVTLTEPGTPLAKPSEEDSRRIIDILRGLIFNCIPARGTGGIMPSFLYRDTQGNAKISLPNIMDKAYTLQGLPNEHAADCELRCLIASLVVLASDHSFEYRDVLEHKVSEKAIQVPHIAELYAQVLTATWASLHT